MSEIQVPGEDGEQYDESKITCAVCWTQFIPTEYVKHIEIHRAEAEVEEAGIQTRKERIFNATIGIPSQSISVDMPP
ncbi:MAG: hypothetical protein EZS28_049112, partial [Streblomastix strix]